MENLFIILRLVRQYKLGRNGLGPGPAAVTAGLAAVAAATVAGLGPARAWLGQPSQAVRPRSQAAGVMSGL